MFTIKPGQLAAIESARQKALVQSLLKEVKEHHPELCAPLTDSAVKALIEKGLSRAAEHGFEQESSLVSFVHLMFGVAPSFYLHPHVKAIFANPDVPLEDRLERLSEELSDREWEEIAQAHDASAW